MKYLLLASVLMAGQQAHALSDKQAVLDAIAIATHKTNLKCTIVNPMTNTSVQSALYRTVYPTTAEVSFEGNQIKVVSKIKAVNLQGKMSETVALITTSADERSIVRFEETVSLISLNQTNSGTIRQPKITSKVVVTPVSNSVCE